MDGLESVFRFLCEVPRLLRRYLRSSRRVHKFVQGPCSLTPRLFGSLRNPAADTRDSPPTRPCTPSCSSSRQVLRLKACCGHGGSLHLFTSEVILTSSAWAFGNLPAFIPFTRLLQSSWQCSIQTVTEFVLKESYSQEEITAVS
jgi:hypothetical protein